MQNVALVHLIYDDHNETPITDEYSGKIVRDKVEETGSGSIDHIAFRATNAEQLKIELEKKNIFYRQREVPNINLFQIFLEDPNRITVEINYYT